MTAGDRVRIVGFYLSWWNGRVFTLSWRMSSGAWVLKTSEGYETIVDEKYLQPVILPTGGRT